VAALPDNFYGLSSGLAPAPTGETPTLTAWLTDLLDQIAGKTAGGPLTFGDLWDCPPPPNAPDGPDGGAPGAAEPSSARPAAVDSPEFGRPLPFPDARDVPLVVATRMSLSFPVLLGAIPLYAVDWGHPDNQEARRQGKPPRYERCWFSDGGICSNFPVHFFDR